jgi:uncharacterized protein
MPPFQLPFIPAELTWWNEPVEWNLGNGEELSILTGEETDLFTDPDGTPAKDNAPCALFTPPDPSFRLSAKVTAEFAATYDAGALQVHAGTGHWGKLALEYSPNWKPTIVSVVTNGVSDDCNSVSLDARSIFLRISRNSRTFSFHYSIDGKFWYLVRYFSLGDVRDLRIGFSAQSPIGARCRALFSEILYLPGPLSDIRNGE